MGAEAAFHPKALGLRHRPALFDDGVVQVDSGDAMLGHNRRCLVVQIDHRAVALDITYVYVYIGQSTINTSLQAYVCAQ